MAVATLSNPINIIEELGIDPKAYALINEINFLVSESEAQAFINIVKREMLGKHEYMLPHALWAILSSIRTKRIYSQKISLNEFLREYGVNPRCALEKLLIEPMTAAKMYRLDRSQLSARTLYIAHKNNPEYTLMEMILYHS